MLQHTFVHISGIGRKTEKNFWTAGINAPESIVMPSPDRPFPPKLHLVKSHQKNAPPFESRGPHYWAANLPAREHWRLFPHFRSGTAYLDIETTGRFDSRESITTIALYDGTTIFTFIRGKNLHHFAEVVRQYEILVTYNGKCFDIPVIKAELGITMDHVQLDLRPLLRNLGYVGGLKGCEKQLGLDRGDLDGVDGSFAPVLWRHYRRTGDAKALNTLLAYNIADTVNLEILMVEAYNRNVAQTPFADTLMLPLPEPPSLPFVPDSGLIHALRG